MTHRNLLYIAAILSLLLLPKWNLEMPPHPCVISLPFVNLFIPPPKKNKSWKGGGHGYKKGLEKFVAIK